MSATTTAVTPIRRSLLPRLLGSPRDAEASKLLAGIPVAHISGHRSAAAIGRADYDLGHRRRSQCRNRSHQLRGSRPCRRSAWESRSTDLQYCCATLGDIDRPLDRRQGRPDRSCRRPSGQARSNRRDGRSNWASDTQTASLQAEVDRLEAESLGHPYLSDGTPSGELQAMTYTQRHAEQSAKLESIPGRRSTAPGPSWPNPRLMSSGYAQQFDAARTKGGNASRSWNGYRLAAS